MIYTAASPSGLPNADALAGAWHVDGMLLTGSGGGGTLTLGATLKGKLTAAQIQILEAPIGPQTVASWVTSTLARADAFLSGTHVFDGVGALDATSRKKAEAAAKSLSTQLNAPVYIDIALGGADPSSTAAFNGASLSSGLGNAVVIALAVSGNEIAGSIDSAGSLLDTYQTGAPWTADTLSSQTAANGDVGAALLAAIGAVKPMPSFVAGHHVYDYGKLLSAQSVNTAASLGSHIENAGGGRVVIYTAASPSGLPNADALAGAWHVDGMLLTGSGGGGTLTLGATLKGKLTAAQIQILEAPIGPQTVASWVTSTLARADAFLSGTHVFDGVGALDATSRKKAEAAAKSLSTQLNAPVYIDIALGGADPSSTAAFNGASLSSGLGNAVVIALAVSGNEIAGSIDSAGSLLDTYQTGAPWTADTLSSQTAANGDVGAALLAAIGAVKPMPSFVAGHHVYDYGKLLSAQSVNTAASLGSHIENAGGGRVVIYTAASPSGLPNADALAGAWHVDGMLLTGSGGGGTLTLGATLKGKLTAAQIQILEAPIGPQTVASWVTSTLARADAFLSGTHVFDGVGALDATSRKKAEAAAKSLSTQLNAPVYIDIALGGADPSSTAAFNGASLSSGLGNAVVIALAVSGNEIAGSIDSAGSLLDTYQTGAPWTADTLSSQTAANGDVGAALLAAIGAVHVSTSYANGPTLAQILPWLIFVIVVVVLSITAPFLWGPWLIRRLSGTAGPIQSGLPGEAVSAVIADTGPPASMSDGGPEAPK